MPATAARIGFVGQEFRTSVSEDAAVKTKYGSAARDTQDGVIETFFDSEADYAAMGLERFNLLMADRRRFNVTVSELLDFSSGGLAFTETAPTARLIDDEKSFDADVIITGIDSYDFENNRTVLAVWG